MGEDADGQMSMVMSEKTQLEHQITGQMSIHDVLEEWERPDMRLKLHLKRLSSRSLSQLRQEHFRRQETSWRD